GDGPLTALRQDKTSCTFQGYHCIIASRNQSTKKPLEKLVRPYFSVAADLFDTFYKPFLVKIQKTRHARVRFYFLCIRKILGCRLLFFDDKVERIPEIVVQISEYNPVSFPHLRHDREVLALDGDLDILLLVFIQSREEKVLVP